MIKTLYSRIFCAFLLSMFKKIILISLCLLLAGILIPSFSYWQNQEWLALFYILGTLAGFFTLLFLYLKNPVWILFLIPPTMILGQIFTLKIRDWYYEISLPEILIIILAIFFVLQTLARRKFKALKFPLLLALLGLYIILSLLSLGWAQNISRAVIAVRILVFHFLIFFLTINLVKKTKDFHLALLSLPLTSFLVASQLIFKVASQGGFFQNYALAREVMITPVGKWVYIAAIIAQTIPLTYALLIVNRKIGLKVLLAGQVILGLMAVGLTLGKGEIIAVACGLGYFFRKQKTQRYLAAIILLAGLLIAIFPLASYSGKFLERIYRTSNDPNTRFRLTEFKSAPQIFFQNPFSGVGIGNLKLEYKNLLPWGVETESNNLFLQIILELGLVGLAILILIIRQIYYELKRLKSLLQEKEGRIIYLGFVSTLIVVLLNSLVEVTLIGLYYGIIFWYILGLILVQKNLLASQRKYES